MRDEKPPVSPIEAGSLPVVKAPDAIWNAIVAELDAPRKPAGWRIPRSQWVAAWALAAAALVLYLTRPASPALPSWQVVRLDGAPIVGSKALAESGRMAVGEWLQTDASSRARIAVADIGTVEVEPNSRVRLVATKAN